MSRQPPYLAYSDDWTTVLNLGIGEVWVLSMIEVIDEKGHSAWGYDGWENMNPKCIWKCYWTKQDRKVINEETLSLNGMHKWLANVRIALIDANRFTSDELVVI